MYNYFVAYDVFRDISSRERSIVSYRAPSYGLFKRSIASLYWFGIPRNVESAGLVMDVDSSLEYAVHKENDIVLWRDYISTIGTIGSAFEHQIPELFLDSTVKQVEGISAVKALQLATQEGQKIWMINKANLNTALAAISFPVEVENEIRNGVVAGLVVTTHSIELNYRNKKYVGYLILDPETGAGAYKISGGSDGGVIDFAEAVAGQPGLLIPTCNLPFFEQMIQNFVTTNAAVYGLTAPPGITLLTGGAVAEAAGGFTLLTAIRLSIRNPIFALGNLRVALFISAINYFLVSLAFEFGLLLGSAFSAATCRRNEE